MINNVPYNGDRVSVLLDGYGSTRTYARTGHTVSATTICRLALNHGTKDVPGRGRVKKKEVERTWDSDSDSDSDGIHVMELRFE